MISAAITLISAGVCLSIGFHYGKKLTNQLDYVSYLCLDKCKKALSKTHDCS